MNYIFLFVSLITFNFNMNADERIVRFYQKVSSLKASIDPAFLTALAWRESQCQTDGAKINPYGILGQSWATVEAATDYVCGYSVLRNPFYKSTTKGTRSEYLLDQIDIHKENYRRLEIRNPDSWRYIFLLWACSGYDAHMYRRMGLSEFCANEELMTSANKEFVTWYYVWRTIAEKGNQKKSSEELIKGDKPVARRITQKENDIILHGKDEERTVDYSPGNQSQERRSIPVLTIDREKITPPVPIQKDRRIEIPGEIIRPKEEVVTPTVSKNTPTEKAKKNSVPKPSLPSDSVKKKVVNNVGERKVRDRVYQKKGTPLDSTIRKTKILSVGEVDLISELELKKVDPFSLLSGSNRIQEIDVTGTTFPMHIDYLHTRALIEPEESRMEVLDIVKHGVKPDILENTAPEKVEQKDECCDSLDQFVSISISPKKYLTW